MWALQIMAEATGADHGAVILAAIALQDGYLGGWVSAPGGGKGWRVQTFFQDAPNMPVSAMPNGMRRVILTEALLKRMAKGAT